MAAEKKVRFTKSKICQLLNIPFDGEEEEYSGISFAREAAAGSLAILQKSRVDPYSAVKHEDAVHLAAAAMKRGAKRILIDEKLIGYPTLVVPGKLFDSCIAILADYRSQYPAESVEVTGSYGKTTTVCMIKSVLDYKYNTFGGGFNNSNTIRRVVERVQRLDDSMTYYLQEASEAPVFGVPGMISEIIRNKVGVLTMIGTSHLEQMGSQKRILESCLTLQQGMPEDGILILNGDDPLQRKARTERKTWYYGVSDDKLDFYADHIVCSSEGISFDVHYDGKSVPAKIYCIEKHNVQNALAAYAVGVACGMKDEDIVAGLKLYRSEGIRQNHRKIAGINFYFDCYNASVESMKSALNTVSELEVAPGGRRIAVLGDIKEIGTKSASYHKTVGEYVAQSKVDILICVGEEAEYIAETAKKNKSIQIYTFDDLKDAEELLKQIMKKEDIVLLKASRAMEFEKISDDLTGTWFNEEEEKSVGCQGGKFNYRLFPSHAVIKNAKSMQRQFILPRSIKKKKVTGIEANAFEGIGASYIYLPLSIVNIRKQAFFRAHNLMSVVIPPSVKLIDEEAFADCISLREVTVENGCLHIGNRAFRDCEKLQRIMLPASVRQIEPDAFIGCEKLTLVCPAGSYAAEFAEQTGLKSATY